MTIFTMIENNKSSSSTKLYDKKDSKYLDKSKKNTT